MQNPHIIVDPATKRCLCGSYIVGLEPRPYCCDDLISLATKKANEGDPGWLLVCQMIKPLITDRG